MNTLRNMEKKGLHFFKEINNVASNVRYSVNIQLCSRYSKFRPQVMCFILPKVTGNVPALYIEHD